MSETTPRRSEQINELAAALAKAQAAMENPHCDRENTFFNNAPYATLSSVRNCVIPALSANGLSLVQSPKYAEGSAGCEWVLMHSSGQFISGELMVPITKKDAQGIGAAVTYCRRFSMQSIAGVSGEVDDDGNKAVEKPEPPKTEKKAPPKKAPDPPKPADKPKDAKIPEVTDSASAHEFIKQVLWHWWQCGTRDEANAVAKFICGHTYDALSKDGNLCRDNYQKFQAAHDANDTELKSKALAASTPV